MVKDWCEEAGGNIDISFDLKFDYIPPTKLDETNIYWVAFKSACDEMLELLLIRLS